MYQTQMKENKGTKTMKQNQVDFSLIRKQRGLLLYVIRGWYTKLFSVLPNFKLRWAGYNSVYYGINNMRLT